MRFIPTPLAGAFLVESDAHEDERGAFYRTFCREEFEEHGLQGDFVQASLSRNHARGTLRGMHFQAEPRPEHKLVRCVRGAVHDVIVDLRPASATYRRWFGAELSAANRAAMFIPAGFAHGFLTLEDHSDVLYQMTEAYVPGLAAGVRWNDPSFGIAWPIEPVIVSARDRDYPDFRPEMPSSPC
jgi:dTDP-4-dehydrorhamnose 3,5-epimerase